MSIDYQKLRLDGIYQQDNEGNLMLRVKVPAGVLSSTQVETVCDISEAFSNGRLHLTTRGSVELHGLRYEQLEEIFRRFSAVGLTSRGACGGAVRGISCSTTFSPSFAVCQAVARNLSRHFTGNPYFEGLPKKFKIGIDGSEEGSRHLIQDVGLVHVGQAEGQNLFDLWCAGGLGREPQAGFLFERAVPEERLIPLIAAIVSVYRANTPPPKRLKFLLRQIGEQDFRILVAEELTRREIPLRQVSLSAPLTSASGEIVEVAVFAGEIGADIFRRLAGLAREAAGGFLAVTADQNVALLLADPEESGKVKSKLVELGLAGGSPGQGMTCRVCPGNHECKMGLSATRDVARKVLDVVGEKGRTLSFAISGCPNSCSQPQLADVGILTSKRRKSDDGISEPLFCLYRRRGEGLGEAEAEDLDLETLLEHIARIG